MSARDEPSYLAFARANVREARSSSPMIVRELLARIDRDAAAAQQAHSATYVRLEGTDALQTAVDAVLQLHQPDDDGDCAYCADYFCDTRKAEFPCPTVRAVNEALEGDRG